MEIAKTRGVITIASHMMCAAAISSHARRVVSCIALRGSAAIARPVIHGIILKQAYSNAKTRFQSFFILMMVQPSFFASS